MKMSLQLQMHSLLGVCVLWESRSYSSCHLQSIKDSCW